MELDLQRVRELAREATTEDLLDRVTVYRGGMDPEALTVLEEELRRREVDPTDIRQHAEQHGRDVLWERPGLAAQCAFCRQPAVMVEMRWFRLLGLIPLFQRPVPCCAAHAEGGQRSAVSDRQPSSGGGPPTS